MTKAILIEDLCKTYMPKNKKQSPKVALSDVSLCVEPGQIYGLLGPNGAGKSTLINILAGLVVKTSGKVHVSGFDIEKNVREVKACLGIVPQEINIDPFFTPYEVLEMQAGFYGLTKKERRTEEILDVLQLSDKRNAYVRWLSGGMKRRLLVAKALVHKPPILILDEPTAGVDVELRRHLWAYVKKLHAQGTTVILTTHYLEEAEELCDHITIMNHGQVVLSGEKGKILKGFGKKSWSLQLQNKLTGGLESLGEDWAQMLTQHEFTAEIVDGDLKLQGSCEKLPVGKVISCLEARGNGVVDITAQNASLEDVFVETTAAKAVQ